MPERTEEVMLGVIKAIPETIKNWRDNRDLLYQLVAGISAALVVTALVGGKRPSDSVAVVAHGLGITPVANWFSTNAPPVLAENSPTLQSIALSAVLLLVAGMVIVPLWRGRHAGNQMFGYEPLRLLGSPAASTTWVFLVIAAQQGDITSTLQRWEYTAVSVAAWTIGGLFGAGVLYLLANRCGFGELVKILFWPVAVVVYRVGFGACATIFAIALAAISLPLSIISWMSGLESDHSRNARYEMERKRAERAPQPTGALVVPICAA
ncbi:hypothetical protein [Brachybacterium hainanense]|uniref:Yip1 domain-containing protein n=1 Tax=Brachybacterium hainanense TaxID=1541174 RepID=A0ABV6RA21_9MICO